MEFRFAYEKMEPSALAVDVVTARLSEIFQRFDVLRGVRALVTLRIDETLDVAKPDLFQIKLRIETGRLAGLLLDQSAPSFYVALANIGERLTERSLERAMAV